MDEIWKDIENYNGDYQVSNLGRVKSFAIGERILKPTDNGKGYLIVGLSCKAHRKNHYVHRLVAFAFIDNPNEYSEINHKDENIQNNSYENLEWCSRKYNCNYGSHNEKLSNSLIGRTPWNKGCDGVYSDSTIKVMSERAKTRFLNKENHPMYGKHLSEESIHKIITSNSEHYKRNRKKVICINTGKIYESITEAANELKLHGADITNVCKHKYNTVHKYKFEYYGAG